MYEKLRSDILNSIQDVTKRDFKIEVLDNIRPALVAFTTDWCKSCLDISEILNSLSEDYADQIDFFRVDVDMNMALSKEYNVELLPTLIFFSSGKEMKSLMGNTSEGRINNQLKKLL